MRKERISCKMPDHEESCVLCKSLGRSLEMYKLSSYTFLYIFERVFIYSCMHMYTSVYNCIHVLVYRVDAHYIFEGMFGKIKSESKGKKGREQS